MPQGMQDNACLAFTAVTITTTNFFLFDKMSFCSFFFAAPFVGNLCEKQKRKKKWKSCTWLISGTCRIDPPAFYNFVFYPGHWGRNDVYSTALPTFSVFFRRWFFLKKRGKRKTRAIIFQCCCIKIDVSFNLPSQQILSLSLFLFFF
jgi:hypothetical protein